MTTATREKTANGTVAPTEPTKTPATPAAPPPTPRYPVSSPFAMLQKFSEDIDRLMEGVMPVFGGTFPVPRMMTMPSKGVPMPWAPRIDVSQKADALIVSADLPGLTKDDIKVDITPGMLTLHGERKEEKETKGQGFHHAERTYGAFYRDIPLPEGVIVEKAAVTFKNGVLTITIPTAAKAGARRLEVRED